MEATKRRFKVFRKSWVLSDHKKPPVEGDISRDVKGDILALRPTQQGKRQNLGDPKDQREILWLVRERSVRSLSSDLACADCSVWSCTNEQIRRAVWFWHDLRGDASKLPGHTSAMMHLASGTQASVDLTPKY